MSTPYPGADGAGALQGFGQQWPMRSAAMMIAGGLEGGGPSQPPIADVNTISRRRRSGRPPGDRPAMAHPFLATMIGGGLEGCGPSQPPAADVNIISRRRRSGRPPG